MSDTRLTEVGSMLRDYRKQLDDTAAMLVEGAESEVVSNKVLLVAIAGLYSAHSAVVQLVAGFQEVRTT